MANTGNNTQQNIILGVQMNTQQATAAIGQLGAAVTAVGAQPIGTQSVETYRQAIRAARQEMEVLGRTHGLNSQEFVTASGRVQNLINDYDELQIASNALNADNRMRAIGTAAQGATAALQGVVGAMAFFGVESENAAVITAKLQGLMAFSGALDGIGDLKDGYNSFLRMLGLNITAATTQNTVAATGVATTTAQTVATQVQTAATNTATTATRGLGFAMKAMGIGLIISAVAYLAMNWDSVTGALNKLLPAGKNVGSMFNTLKSTAMGVGNTIINFIATPFKAITSLLKGDLEGFKNALANGFNVKKNFTDSFNDQELSNQKTHNQNIERQNIESQERHLTRLKNQGKNVEKEELALQKKKLSILQKGTKEYEEQQKKIEDIQDASYKNLHSKKDSDSKKNSDKAKAATDKAKAEREKNQKEIDDNQIAALEYIASENLKVLTKFESDKKIIENETNAQLAKKGITPDQATKIKKIGKNKTDNLNTENNLSNTNTTAQTDLVYAEINNSSNENDTPEQATAKINNISNAKMAAENAAFQLKKLQLTGQKGELALLEADHEKKIVGIGKEASDGKIKVEKEASDAKIKLSNTEKEVKEANLATVGNALGGLSNLIGESTVAGKGISIAQATIDTYAGATKALGQGGIFGYIGAAGIIATGLANIKKITSTKIPNTSGGNMSTPSMSAPIINSTILNQAQSGISDLRGDVQSKNSEPVRAFIVAKDIDSNKKRNDFINSISSLI